MNEERPMGRFSRWLDERSGLVTFLRRILSTPYAGGAAWQHTFGIALLLLAITQFFTGILLTFHYVPHPDHAYDSVQYIQNDLTFGNIIRGLHHWGASAIITVLGLHLIQILLYGAYKKPRQFNWWTGLILLLVVVTMAFTGYTLPWDQKGYWGTNVAISLLEEIPPIGISLAAAVRGGMTVGINTLTQLAGLHTAALPAILLLIVILHLMAFRKLGPTPSWRISEGEEHPVPYSPNQAIRDTLVFFLVFVVILVLALFSSPELAGKADPTAATADAKPEWFFLWFYYGMRFAEGNLALLFEPLLPALVGIYFILLPLIDRSRTTDPLHRWAYLVIPALVALTIAALTLLALAESPPPPAEHVGATEEEQANWEKAFFLSECAKCHGKEGEGSDFGAVRFDRALFEKKSTGQLINSILSGTPGGMPGFSEKLTKEKAGYMLTFLKEEYGKR